MESWYIGLPVILAASIASTNLSANKPQHLSLLGLLGFVFLFIRESIKGGVDVSIRVLRSRPDINPGFKKYHLKLENGQARVLLVNCVSLLPGTLSAGLEGSTLELHILDTRQDPEAQLRRIEHAISKIFKSKPENRDG
jgi:multicomponent Na+:H+ antiporter subunit E